MSAHVKRTGKPRRANKADIPAISFERERFELSCGAILLVSRRAGAPVFSVRAQIRGGASRDPEGAEGTSFLTGRFVDQGTADHTEEDMADLLEPVAGEIAGDANGVAGSVAGDAWKLLLGLLSEALVRPAYPKNKIAQQKGRLLSQLKVEQDDPRVQGTRNFRRLIYGDHWLGRAAYGTFESVSGIEVKHLRKHHARHWTARRCIIAVCGDVEPERVRALLEKLLKDWAPGTYFDPEPPTFPSLGKRAAAFRAQRKQVHVFLGHLGIKRSHPDYAALTVMDHVLGAGPGFTNRVSRKLRDEQGLAYSVYSDIHSSAGVLPGTFVAYIGTSPENVGTAVAGILREVRLMQEKRVPLPELTVAKDYLVGSFVLGFERSGRRASYMIAEEIHKLPADNLLTLPRKFAAVTADDVLRVARENLHPDACCLSTAGPTPKRELRSMLDS
ncbi:MAG: zinc protease [Chlamydiales bacterium]|jgi:zinc protease